MIEYLNLFRDRIGSGAARLAKRVVLPYIGAFIVLGLIGIILIMPLFLMALGFGAMDITGYQQSLDEMNQSLQSGNDPMSVLSSYFGSFNAGLMAVAVIAAVLYYSWFVNVIMTINDNEIRTGNPGVFTALRSSLNVSIINLILHIILYMLFYFAVLAIFMFITGQLMSMSKVLGILFGFLGFIMVLMLLLRLLLAVPAIIHGKMNVSSAWAYSFRHITWKRSGLILLILLGVFVAFFILALIIASVMGSNSESMSTGNFIIQQIVSLIVNALLMAYGLSLLSGLYFRYSNDSGETDNSEHLISEEGN